MKIGTHLSFDGFYGSAFNALEYGMNTCQVFMRNNRNCKMRNMPLGEYMQYNDLSQRRDFKDIVIHGVYTVNPASPQEVLWDKTFNVTKEELQTLKYIDGRKYYVMHPGSAVGQTEDEALKRVSDLLHELTPYYGDTKICMETMAGQGTQLLSSILQIYKLIKLCEDIPAFALTVDTCHVWASGTDFDMLLRFLKNFDKGMLGVLHVNNSQNEFGSRVDRHAPLLQGQIPNDKLIQAVRDCSDWNPECPIILETPTSGIIEDYQSLKMLMTQ